MILTTGVFDILHSGHFNLFKKAKEKGNLLIGLQSDEGALKFNKKTILNYKQRYLELKSLGIANEILKYHSANDLKKIILKKNVTTVIQGNDFHLTGNRENFVNFLKKNKIKLILHPRTENISSSMIKNKILFSKNNLFNNIHLKMLNIKYLYQYEKFSKARVQRLYSSIKQSKIIQNPITVVKYKKKLIIIDGNNRLEALRLLHCNFIPCLVFDYSDIDLIANTFFFDSNKKLISRASELIPKKFKYQKNFKKISKDDIYDLILDKKKIACGRTFHLQPYFVINLNIHLNDLKKEFNFEKFILSKLNQKQIRLYYNSVFNFND